MPFQVHYRKERTAVLHATFRCGGCGYSSPVEVMSKGTGYSNNNGLKQRADIANQAADMALAGAVTTAKLLLSLACCPKCGWRDLKAEMDFKRKIKKVLLIGAAVEGLGCIAVGAWWLLGAPVILAILGGFALVGGTTMVVIAPLTLRSIFGSAVKNVRFESPGT